MHALPADAPAAMPPRLTLSNGTLEGLKWLALVLMTGDHINKYLFNGTLPWLFEAGRLAMPIFATVLGYNLARPDALQRGRYTRTMARLVIAGSAASVPFLALGGLAAAWWPLNAMFTLLVVAAVAWLLDRGSKADRAAAVLLFAVGGSMVEFWWPAVALGLGIWFYARRPTWSAATVSVMACAALTLVNGNLWALLTLPLLLLASRADLPIPRVRWAFYGYYPLHLAALWLVRMPMREAGYLFF